MAEDLLFDRNSILGSVLEGAALRTLWQEHQSAARDHSVLLWGVMMLGLWERAHSLQTAAPASKQAIRVQGACDNRL